MVRVNEPLCTKTGREISIQYIYSICCTKFLTYRNLQKSPNSYHHNEKWKPLCPPVFCVLPLLSCCHPGRAWQAGDWWGQSLSKQKLVRGWVQGSPGESRDPHLENKEPRCECYRVETIMRIRVLMITSLGVTTQSQCCKVSLTDNPGKVKIIRVAGEGGLWSLIAPL